MGNCRGCGVELEPSEEQVNAAVDQVLESSVQDALDTGGVCPLCGHSKDVPYSRRKPVLFGLLLASLLAAIVVAITIQRSRQTERAAAAKDAVSRMNLNQDVARLLGTPITAQAGIQGEIKQDETSWIKFSYDSLSRITRAGDDAGHWTQYEYNPGGMLISVIYSSGRQRHYDYDGVLMTRVTDEKGRVLVRNWFRQRSLERQQFGNDGVYSYAYDWAPNEYFPRKVGVTLPDGSFRELSVAGSVPEFVRNYHHQGN
jgi:type II secretory pathway pseudopilin PulG